MIVGAKIITLTPGKAPLIPNMGQILPLGKCSREPPIANAGQKRPLHNGSHAWHRSRLTAD